MKRIGLAAVLAASAGVALAADVLQQLKVSADDARREVVAAVAKGSVNFWPARQALKAAGPEARAALVEQAMLWAKAYVASPQFAADYARMREERKPRATERKLTVDQEIEEQRKKRAADLEKSKKDVAKMPAEYRKMAEEGLKAAEASMKQLDTPEYRKMERDGLVMQRQQDERRLAGRVAEWEKEYPADAKALVKTRLQEFLRATADVDFAAKMSGQRFADPAYEKKSSEWKLAYRAGKEATAKARAVAQAWLGELK